MLANYVKIARLHLWTNKLYTSLNAGGLAVGLTACVLIETKAALRLINQYFKN